MQDKDVSKDAICVAIEIYAAQKKGNSYHFGTLVKILNGRISRNTISKCIDILTDIAIVKESWAKKNNCWCRIIEISNDGKPLVEKWTQELVKL